MEQVPTKFPKKVYKTEIGGRELIIKTGEYANQASGAVTVQYGDTVVLATCVVEDKPRDDVGYFPLMVDYQEKFYAAGKIKGSRFIKREGKPSDEAVISGRVIDRSIRPLFPQHIVNDIQVVVDVLSFDGENDADIPAIIGASAALAVSNIPFGPLVGAARIGIVGGELVLNPTYEARGKSDLDMILSVVDNKVVMVEAGAKEVPEEKVEEAIEFGKKHISKICALLKEMEKEIGLPKKDFPKPELEAKIKKEIDELSTKRISEILYGDPSLTRKKDLHELNEEIIEQMVEKHGEEGKDMYNDYFDSLAEGIVRDNILKDKKRIGDRALDEIRPLEVDTGVLPRTHGSGMFRRGETQVLSTTTLASPGAEQIVDEMEVEHKKRFMHHYNFPPYSVGEVSPLRGPSRRDIGHGALAERALEKMIPDKEKFPYTIRLVSEVLGSNGSSSMASICGSTLALMDAGVPIKEPVAGIAMGLAIDENGKYAVLTDLQDLEDSDGGMDFKVAGTKNGITVVQMDTKSNGLTKEIVKDTLKDAKKAIVEILDVIHKQISEPKKDLSPYAPRIVVLHINPEKIGDVIGPGGKIINGIIDKTGVEIDIEEDGTVMISSVDEPSIKEATETVKNLTREAKAGEQYNGKVVRIMDFGAFVELFPGTDGLIHISKLSKGRVERVTDVVKEGDMVTVKVLEIDSEGRVNLGLVDKK